MKRILRVGKASFKGFQSEQIKAKFLSYQRPGHSHDPCAGRE